AGKELLVETATLVGAKGRRPVPIRFVRFSPGGEAVYFSLADGTTIQRCALKAGKRADLFPGDIQLGAPTPLGLTRDGKYWLELIDLFNPDRTELQVVPNLLKERDDKLVGKPELVFRHDGRVAHAVSVNPDVVVSLSETGVLRRWQAGKARPV